MAETRTFSPTIRLGNQTFNPTFRRRVQEDEQIVEPVVPAPVETQPEVVAPVETQPEVVAPVAPTAPVVVEQPVVQAQPEVVAPVAPEVAAPQAVAPTQPVVETTTPTVETTTPTVETTPVVEAPVVDYNSLIEQNYNDLQGLMTLYSDPNTPSAFKSQIFDRIQGGMNEEKGMSEANAIMTAAQQGDPDASLRVAQELTNPNEEGSWLKLALFGFISPTMARDEAAKLGYGRTRSSVMLGNNQSYSVETDAQGRVYKAYDASGNLVDDETLAQIRTSPMLGAGGGKLDIVGGTYVNDATGEVGRVVSLPNGQSYVQTETGRKPLTGFRPQGTAGSLADQRSRLVQELNLKLQGKTEEEKMAITRDYNTRLVGAGYSPVQPYEINLAAPQISGGGAAPTTTQVAPTTTQVAPAPVAEQPVVQPEVVEPTTTQVAPTTTQVAPTTTEQPVVQPEVVAPTTTEQPVAEAPTTTERPTLSELQAQSEAESKGATVSATAQAEIREQMPTIRNNAEAFRDNMKAFRDDVDVGYAYGRSTVFAGGETPTEEGDRKGLVGRTIEGVATFIDPRIETMRSRREQLTGQSFLSAFETLKGGGQITEVEGEKATKALSTVQVARQDEFDAMISMRDADYEVAQVANTKAAQAGLPPEQYPYPNLPTRDEFAKQTRAITENRDMFGMGEGELRVPFFDEPLPEAVQNSLGSSQPITRTTSGSSVSNW